MKRRTDSLDEKTCRRCGYVWLSRIREPRQCPRCKSPAWDQRKGGDAGKAWSGVARLG